MSCSRFFVASIVLFSIFQLCFKQIDCVEFSGSHGESLPLPEFNKDDNDKSSEMGMSEDGDQKKTGSPFDYLNEVLENDSDLKETKKVLDTPEAKDLVNKYGSNLTIFAPNNEAFENFDLPQDQWSPEQKKQFLENHFVVGQRIPIYQTNNNNQDPNDNSDDSNTPQIIKANLEIVNGPLLHVIDRIRVEPFTPSMMISMQPALSMLSHLIRMTEFEPQLNKERSTFFCPYNSDITRTIAKNVGPNNLEQTKEFLSDHVIPGMEECPQKVSSRDAKENLNLNLNSVNCQEIDSQIMEINGKRFPKRKISMGILGVIYLIEAPLFPNAPYMSSLLPPPMSGFRPFRLVMIPRIVLIVHRFPQQNNPDSEELENVKNQDENKELGPVEVDPRIHDRREQPSQFNSFQPTPSLLKNNFFNRFKPQFEKAAQNLRQDPSSEQQQKPDDYSPDSFEQQNQEEISPDDTFDEPNFSPSSKGQKKQNWPKKPQRPASKSPFNQQQKPEEPLETDNPEPDQNSFDNLNDDLNEPQQQEETPIEPVNFPDQPQNQVKNPSQKPKGLKTKPYQSGSSKNSQRNGRKPQALQKSKKPIEPPSEEDTNQIQEPVEPENDDDQKLEQPQEDQENSDNQKPEEEPDQPEKISKEPRNQQTKKKPNRKPEEPGNQEPEEEPENQRPEEEPEKPENESKNQQVEKKPKQLNQKSEEEPENQKPEEPENQGFEEEPGKPEKEPEQTSKEPKNQQAKKKPKQPNQKPEEEPENQKPEEPEEEPKQPEKEPEQTSTEPKNQQAEKKPKQFYQATESQKPEEEPEQPETEPEQASKEPKNQKAKKKPKQPYQKPEVEPENPEETENQQSEKEPQQPEEEEPENQPDNQKQENETPDEQEPSQPEETGETKQQQKPKPQIKSPVKSKPKAQNQKRPTSKTNPQKKPAKNPNRSQPPKTKPEQNLNEPNNSETPSEQQYPESGDSENPIEQPEQQEEPQQSSDQSSDQEKPTTADRKNIPPKTSKPKSAAPASRPKAKKPQQNPNTKSKQNARPDPSPRIKPNRPEILDEYTPDSKPQPESPSDAKNPETSNIYQPAIPQENLEDQNPEQQSLEQPNFDQSESQAPSSNRKQPPKESQPPNNENLPEKKQNNQKPQSRPRIPPPPSSNRKRPQTKPNQQPQSSLNNPPNLEDNQPSEQNPEQPDQEQPQQPENWPSEPFEQERIEQQKIDDELPSFEPSTQISPKTDNVEKFKRYLEQSARQMRCSRFYDWLQNSGVLDELLKKGANSTLFVPLDSASSKLPFNQLTSLNQQPQKFQKLMRLHAVPASFESIYPSRTHPGLIPSQTLSQDRLRLDRSLMPMPGTNRYQPLVSGCPMLDSHQIGPIRMVAVGAVLFPPQPSVDSILKRSPNLKLCNQIAEVAKMTPQLQNPKESLTMFMPSDEAVRKRYTPQQLTSLMQNPNRCRRFIQRHLVRRQVVYTNSIPMTNEELVDPNFEGRSALLPTAFGNQTQIQLRRNQQSLYVNGAHVLFADISTNNGVVHIMNDIIS